MKEMEIKTLRAEIKTQILGDKGIVTALVACFNNIDLGKDRILDGAFDATVKEWKDRGDPLPVIWSHNWNNPELYVGHVNVKDITITAEGLEVVMNYDLNDATARKVFYLQKNRIVTQFSFGYFTNDVEMVQEGKEGMIRNIKSLELFECGPTLLGMNPQTRLLEVASLEKNKDKKAGRTLSSKNETSLKAARDTIDEVLSSIASVDAETSDNSGEGKSLDPIELQKKAIIGSVEALQDRICDAVCDTYCDFFNVIRGVIPSGSAGIVIFDQYDPNTWEKVTYQESFTDDGSIVILAGDRKEVSILEVVVADADASQDPQATSLTSDKSSTINPQRIIDLMTSTRN